MEFNGQAVLVTGASRGIGRALVERLADEDVRVLAGVRDLEGFDPPPRVEPVRMDLGSRSAIDESVDGLDVEVDVLVNNAGAFTAGLLETQDLLGPVHLTRRILPSMLARGSGKIVTNSSIVGYLHFPGITTYSSAKSGVAGFAECLRREQAETELTTLPGEWADKIVDAIESDKDTLGPGGKSALGKLATHMPSFVLDTVAGRAFDR